MCSRHVLYCTDSGSSFTIFTLGFGLNYIALQGTKVLEDREIRLNFHWVTEGIPPQHISAGITKYIGALATPEWKDVEPGRVFTFPWYPVKGA